MATDQAVQFANKFYKDMGQPCPVPDFKILGSNNNEDEEMKEEIKNGEEPV
jgi:hypothetical protein